MLTHVYHSYWLSMPVPSSLKSALLSMISQGISYDLHKLIAPCYIGARSHVRPATGTMR